jgi:hypothetical protein
LWINFGKPSLRIREPYETKSKSEFIRRWARQRMVSLVGQWQLNLFCCYWSLSISGDLLASSSSSGRRVQKAIVHLQGQRLVSVRINPKTGATRFDFDLGSVLDCRRFEKDSQDELWILYKPSGYVLSVQGNGTYCHGPGSQSPRDWHFRSIGPEDVTAI